MARHNRDRFRRDESNWDYGRREDEGRGMWDRTRDEMRSWFGDDEAERRRNQDEMRGQREDWGRSGYGRQQYEQNWGRNYGSDYGAGYGRSGQNRSENTWNAGNRGWNRDESEDWRHLDNYWNDMYGESYPGRAEFSGRQTSERDYRPTFGGENFGGLGGPTNWMGTNRDYRGGMSTRGNFSGRGPRNYKRSDERIQEDINEQLTRHPMIDATEIRSEE